MIVSLPFLSSIHSIITTALLGAVNANNTQQILQFSRLLIGAKHVQESEVVAEIEVLGEGRLSFVPVGANATGEIIIDIKSNDLGGHTVQVDQPHNFVYCISSYPHCRSLCIMIQYYSQVIVYQLVLGSLHVIL